MFDAQQVIHPNQVVTVNSSFVPTFHGAAHTLSLISNSDVTIWDACRLEMQRSSVLPRSSTA